MPKPLSTTVDRPGDFLLGELARLQRENRKLRDRVRKLTESRDHWREEARVWKWGRQHGGTIA